MQKTTYASLQDLVELSIHEEGVVDCGFTLEFDSEDYPHLPPTAYCYEASVTHGDILLFTDKGTFSYFVDYVNDGIMGVELYDWELDN